METIKCTKCKTNKEKSKFLKNSKILAHCQECRDQSKKWRKDNPEQVKKYNKMSSDIRSNEKNLKINFVYAKKPEDNDWTKYESQAEAAEKLELHKSNINKVLKGSLKTTGGYIFKTETLEKDKIEVESWNKIKEDNQFIHKLKGQPSQHRIPHTQNDEGISGKPCCHCKIWQPLKNYNNDSMHWDFLRNECKDCLVKYRLAHRKEIQATNTEYEKNRKLTDPEFKLSKTLRSRLGSALSAKNAAKSTNTLDLTGCSTSFLMKYLEEKFKEGMSWSNHGEWHIDHIIPCSSFNLLDEKEQEKCFHYTNLQPLWASENLSKSNKIT